VVPVSRKDRDRLAVIVVTRDRGIPETKNLGDLLSDCLEHLARRRAAGHERRNTAQGRLLLSEAARLGAIRHARTRGPRERAH
jgi:hypothetical protein